MFSTESFHPRISVQSIFIKMIAGSILCFLNILPVAAKATHCSELPKPDRFTIKNSSTPQSQDSGTPSIWQIQVQSSFGQYTVKTRTYSPSSKSRGSVLVFPTIRGETDLERGVAKNFAMLGFEASVVLTPRIQLKMDQQTVCRIDQQLVLTQQSALAVIDEMERLNPHKPIYLVGASQGAIHALLTRAVSNKIDATWINAPSGRMANLISHANADQAMEFRAQHMKYLGIADQRDYFRYLQKHLRVDPLANCLAQKSPLAIVISIIDRVIPPQLQQEVVDICQPDHFEQVGLSHVITSTLLYVQTRKIARFFDGILK